MNFETQVIHRKGKQFLAHSSPFWPSVNVGSNLSPRAPGILSYVFLLKHTSGFPACCSVQPSSWLCLVCSQRSFWCLECSIYGQAPEAEVSQGAEQPDKGYVCSCPLYSEQRHCPQMLSESGCVLGPAGSSLPHLPWTPVRTPITACWDLARKWVGRVAGECSCSSHDKEVLLVFRA